MEGNLKLWTPHSENLEEVHKSVNTPPGLARRSRPSGSGD